LLSCWGFFLTGVFGAKTPGGGGGGGAIGLYVKDYNCVCNLFFLKSANKRNTALRQFFSIIDKSTVLYCILLMYITQRTLINMNTLNRNCS
jgi:hypothetical protein